MRKEGMLAATTALIALLGSMPAMAQDTPPGTMAPPEAAADDGSQVGDIIVTAQRRDESVQDVPIAISAFSGELLRAQGVSNTLQIGQYVPNLVAQNNTGLGSANAYFLRGLGNTETIATFDPPVGTYVDDIYLSRQNANNLSLFDVERVEVLRGPQGTLFGRNTTGGAINVILSEPGDEFGGYAEVGYGRFDKYMARASVDVPLADSFFAKISGYYQDDKGYVRNTTTGDRLNDDDGWGARLGLRGELSPMARWSGSYAHIVGDGENILNFECDPANPSDCDGRFVTTGLPEAETLDTSPFAPLVIRGRKAFYGLSNRTETDLIISDLALDLSDELTLELITGYVNLTQQFALDFFDGRGSPNLAFPNPIVRRFPRGGFTITNDGQHEQFSQEIKLNGSLADGLIDFVLGAYYLDEKNRTDFADVFSIFTGAPGGLGLLLADRILRNKTEAYAGYIQADFNVTEQFKLTAGVRYTDETKAIHYTDNRPVRAVVAGRVRCGTNPAVTPTALCLENSNLFAANGVAIPEEQSVGIWTPRFAVNFEPNEDILLFASATRGFKSGGWNARGTVPGELLPFGPEKVWSYEAGIKSDLFNRRVRANLTAYYLDVSDLQTISGLVNPVTGAITFLTRNFADYENKGVELELTFVPVDGLNLYVNGGYQDDEYKIDQNAPDFDEFGIQSIAAQQRACRAQLAAGQVPATPATPGVVPPNNAPACAAGIVGPDGEITTPVRTPRWSLALGGSYRAEFGNGMSLVPSVNASYRSKYEVGTSNLSIYTGSITAVNGTFPSNPYSGELITGSEGRSYWLVNAGLALNGADDRWQLALECTNCFDETYAQSTLANYTYINPPMTWMVRGRFNF